MQMKFDGMHMNLGNIAKVADTDTRLITAENVYGEKGKGGMAEISDVPQPDVAKIGQVWNKSGAARDLGQKWKIRPCITIHGGETAVIMDIAGSGTIQHIWITADEKMYRDLIIRIYWDGESNPSVESPLGDFFCNGFKKRANISALPINVNPRGGFNSFFPMPFRKNAKIIIENRNPEDIRGFFYAITYAAGPVADDDAYFHAQFRRTNPLPYGEDYLIVGEIKGKGHYVGTYMAWQQNNSGWWGEGEIKFFLDSDNEFPTLCGTGTEDYFGGAWGFGDTFSSPYLGYPLGAAAGSEDNERVGARHGLYRFHIMDPVRFQSELRVTMQAIGWRSEGRYLPLQDDISSVAYWYQLEPHQGFPVLGSRDDLEVI
ncbi:MAG: DUF2961 domain-containing protein [Spirochaetales bacterium]|jgi:hypothetical protein|nr:DUF2961 domain-containing protein [Spirochaetales bacterium]